MNGRVQGQRSAKRSLVDFRQNLSPQDSRYDSTRTASARFSPKRAMPSYARLLYCGSSFMLQAVQRVSGTSSRRFPPAIAPDIESKSHNDHSSRRRCSADHYTIKSPDYSLKVIIVSLVGLKGEKAHRQVPITLQGAQYRYEKAFLQ